MIDERLNLTIKFLSVAEAKELLEKVREIEQRDPSRLLFVWVEGLEDKTSEEAKELLMKIFPQTKWKCEHKLPDGKSAFQTERFNGHFMWGYERCSICRLVVHT